GADRDHGDAADELRGGFAGAASPRERPGAGPAGVVRVTLGRGLVAGRGTAAVPKLRDAESLGGAGGAGVRGAGSGAAGDDVDGVREQPAAGAAESAGDAGGGLSTADYRHSAGHQASNLDADGACDLAPSLV